MQDSVLDSRYCGILNKSSAESVAKGQLLWIVGNLLAVSYLLYMVKITGPYSPVYIVRLSLLPLVVWSLGVNKTNAKPLAWILAAVSYFLVTAAILSQNYRSILNLFVGVSDLLFFMHLPMYFSKNKILRLAKVMLFVGIVSLALDSCYRISNPGYPSLEAEADSLGEMVVESQWYYFYKFNTLMFGDSNTIALAGLASASLYFAVKEKLHSLSRIWLIVIVMVIFSTFSRAGIAALFVLVLIEYNAKWGLIICSLLALAGMMLLFGSGQFEIQGSAVSKIGIAQLTWTYLGNASIGQILFGIGLDNSVDLFGIYTHILPITLIVETGVVGFLMYMSLIFTTSIICKKCFLRYWAPLLVAGMSYYFCIGSPFVFAPLGMMIALDNID